MAVTNPNPYAFALLNDALNKNERERKRAEQENGGYVASTQQALSGPVGVAGNAGFQREDPYSAAVPSSGYRIPEPQSASSGQGGMLGGALGGGQAGGIYGAIIGAALAKQRENKEREEARDKAQLGYQASFAEQLGYPGDELAAMQQAEALKYDPQVNMLGMREPEWKTRAEYVVAPHHIAGNAFKKFLKLPL